MGALRRKPEPWEPTTQPWIVCAANRINAGQADEVIIPGPRHWDKTMHTIARALKVDYLFACSAEQGFIDQFGRFYTREEAMQVARANDQIIVPDEHMLSLTALHSEDLY